MDLEFKNVRSPNPQELRVECYRASYLATGHMPMPVTSESEAWDTIPPFYSPFVLEIPEASSFGSGLTDIMMCDQVRSPLIVTFLALTPFG